MKQEGVGSAGALCYRGICRSRILRVWHYNVASVAKPSKEDIMVRAYITSTVAGALLLGLATAALAVTGEFSNMCSMGLASGKEIQTDCSINSQILGRTYCFGSKEAMEEFMKNPTENLTKAQAYYSSKHPT